MLLAPSTIALIDSVRVKMHTRTCDQAHGSDDIPEGSRSITSPLDSSTRCLERIPTPCTLATMRDVNASTMHNQLSSMGHHELHFPFQGLLLQMTMVPPDPRLFTGRRSCNSSATGNTVKMMRVRLHAMLALLVATVCWLAPSATADITNAVAESNAHPTTDPPSPTPQHSLDESARRVQADDGISAVLVATKKSSDDHSSHSTGNTTSKQNAGPAPAIVLAAGGVVIGVVALAFHRRRTRQNDKDGQDALRQSLLFHDMDYAAM